MVQRWCLTTCFNFFFSFRFRCRSLVCRYGVREIGQTPERAAELSWRKLLHEYARAEFVDVARTHYVLLSDRQRNGLLVVERGTLNLLAYIHTYIILDIFYYIYNEQTTARCNVNDCVSRSVNCYNILLLWSYCNWCTKRSVCKRAGTPKTI